ncbi:hypothetical protein [Burkholderia lata]|uniref:hypothetical protein n=1 Tax=Burkholderia lata (strain ATCC 17760 / DSM 23089 / LMG 22485 / NCIMB 9086 / R18194 / 383) TaxID=482957 RepID=UPI00158390DF|nr:hypothetical protein [Burkholderia lata]
MRRIGSTGPWQSPLDPDSRSLCPSASHQCSRYISNDASQFVISDGIDEELKKLHGLVDAEKLVGVSSVYTTAHGDVENNVMRLRFAFVHI